MLLITEGFIEAKVIFRIWRASVTWTPRERRARLHPAEFQLEDIWYSKPLKWYCEAREYHCNISWRKLSSLESYLIHLHPNLLAWKNFTKILRHSRIPPGLDPNFLLRTLLSEERRIRDQMLPNRDNSWTSEKNMVQSFLLLLAKDTNGVQMNSSSQQRFSSWKSFV